MRIYPPLSADRTLYESARALTEFEVQAELYNRLKQDGFTVRGEWTTGNCRFDIVVFKKRKPLAIIEVKTAKAGSKQTLDTYQGVKYRCYGVPVVQFYSISEYEKLLTVLGGGLVQDSTNEYIPEVKRVYSFRCDRLWTLFKRLRSAAYSAFDTKDAVSDPREKFLMGQIETSLEGYLKQVEELDLFGEGKDRTPIERTTIKSYIVPQVDYHEQVAEQVGA